MHYSCFPKWARRPLRCSNESKVQQQPQVQLGYLLSYLCGFCFSGKWVINQLYISFYFCWGFLFFSTLHFTKRISVWVAEKAQQVVCMLEAQVQSMTPYGPLSTTKRDPRVQSQEQSFCAAKNFSPLLPSQNKRMSFNFPRRAREIAQRTEHMFSCWRPRLEYW